VLLPEPDLDCDFPISASGVPRITDEHCYSELKSAMFLNEITVLQPFTL
jgi:hypothetical protein